MAPVTTWQRFRDLLMLRNPGLRGLFSGSLVAVVIILLILAQFLDAVEVPHANTAANVGILLLGGILLENVASLNDALRREPALFVYERELDDEAKQRQLRFIAEQPPRKVKLWEHSAYTAKYLYDALANCEQVRVVHLLIADPRRVSSWHRDSRILPTLQDIQMTFNNRSDIDLQIRCYETPTVKGRNFDDKLVAIGHYTFDPRPDIGSAGPPLWGAHNAIFIGDTRHGETAAMRLWFNKAFEGSWNNAVGVIEAVEPYLDRFSTTQQEWLRRVSPPGASAP